MNEVQAIQMISTLLDGLDADARGRVLTWAVDRYVENGSTRPVGAATLVPDMPPAVAPPPGPRVVVTDIPAETAPASEPPPARTVPEGRRVRVRDDDMLTWLSQRKLGFTLNRLQEQFPTATRGSLQQWMTVLKKLAVITQPPKKRGFYIPNPDKAKALRKRLARTGTNVTALAFPSSKTRAASGKKAGSK